MEQLQEFIEWMFDNLDIEIEALERIYEACKGEDSRPAGCDLFIKKYNEIFGEGS